MKTSHSHKDVSNDVSAVRTRVKRVGRDQVQWRDAVDPKILMALWMWAILEGIRSARQVARQCEKDFTSLGICGEVGVNYHLLSDFRTAHGVFLDELLTRIIHGQTASRLTASQRRARGVTRCRNWPVLTRSP